jgi:hypothetical protein
MGRTLSSPVNRKTQAVRSLRHELGACHSGFCGSRRPTPVPPQSDLPWRYAAGEALARAIYAPVVNGHRCTAAHMAILEPVLSESVLGTCLTIVGEAMQEAVKLARPSEGRTRYRVPAVRGRHILGRRAQGHRRGQAKPLQPDWKNVFQRDEWMESIRKVTAPPA